LLVETQTGLHVNANGTLQRLRRDERSERKGRLQKLEDTRKSLK